MDWINSSQTISSDQLDAMLDQMIVPATGLSPLIPGSGDIPTTPATLIQPPLPQTDASLSQYSTDSPSISVGLSRSSSMPTLQTRLQLASNEPIDSPSPLGTLTSLMPGYTGPVGLPRNSPSFPSPHPPLNNEAQLQTALAHAIRELATLKQERERSQGMWEMLQKRLETVWQNKIDSQNELWQNRLATQQASWENALSEIKTMLVGKFDPNSSYEL
ncbi:hypothetical protein SISSUDRAFT_1060083 [Sistotremastrum suecicum HHB10207 ss-3]|uniref:Uncharacterized protein n=1 Tax=Sistotremastrum suecicum HHB10207 ss-3 TaxID=1314776 RepID=A0A166FKH8_9AGAM|nr:hypothetical protein SISSUDRAFT_1060083 [Sistotremastrum suecicum HHB10207 ss-3]